jgi:hypothetical protein
MRLPSGPACRGNGWSSISLESVSRNEWCFTAREERNRVRAEIFNLFNHFNPDPTTVDNNLNSATFGSIGLGASGITTRVVQFGAKLRF